MSVHEARTLGATLEQTAQSVCCVSFWHIPGGVDYDQARVVNAYFNDLEIAEKFAERYVNPPAMAVLSEL